MSEQKQEFELYPMPGAIVFYKNTINDIYPAIVTKVNNDNSLNIQVFGEAAVFPKFEVTEGNGPEQWRLNVEEEKGSDEEEKTEEKHCVQCGLCEDEQGNEACPEGINNN